MEKKPENEPKKEPLTLEDLDQAAGGARAPVYKNHLQSLREAGKVGKNADSQFDRPR